MHPRTIKTIRRSNKLIECLKLPSLLNINPRSVYNKIDNLKTYIIENDIELACISESWERPEYSLDKLFDLDDYVVISNVHQRKNHGGRPAIIVKKGKFQVENITNTIVSIPWGVEATWCLLTPKNTSNNSLIKKIAVASIYSKPNSHKKSILHDHLASVFHLLSSKYNDGLHWILCGDTNDLKLDPILHLSSNLKQVVEHPTRLSPPALLDPIITDLHAYYQSPVCEDPIEVDFDKNGENSDHQMVKMIPLNSVQNQVEKIKKRIIYRPLTDEGFRKMTSKLGKMDWDFIEDIDEVEVQMKTFQDTLFSIFDDCFPQKMKVVSNKDEPFYNDKLRKLKNRKSREYSKNRKSKKYSALHKLYDIELKKAKHNFYSSKVQKLKSSNSKQWYKQMKMLLKYDQKDEMIQVDDLKHLSDIDQAEAIAEKFAEVSNEYDVLNRQEIEVPEFSGDQIPDITENDVIEALDSLKLNKSERLSDVPAKIFKTFSIYLCKPLASLIKNAIRKGHWPRFLKVELVTPIPKVSNPKNAEDLRNISGLMNLNKILEKVICKLIISDMKPTLDPAQFANQRGLSIQHYLIKMLDRILSALDRNSKGDCVAIIATMVDWKQAFPRQDATLGIQSFLKNGVRPSLIPILMSFFEDRKMIVKWHGVQSGLKDLPGGGPQGSSVGILEYLSQSNDSASSVPVDDRYKFVDDLTFLEIINLMNIGLASYNIRKHIPSNIPDHNQIIPAKHLKSQKYLEDIDLWTAKNKMMLNPKKTKNMVFNFTKNNQFKTDIKLKKQSLEVMKEMKLLGTYITEDLRWNRNTEELVKNANKRMRLLHAASKFTYKTSDLKTIYKMFIRSSLEISSVVWHSGLTEKNRADIERVQKSAVKIILNERDINYEDALEKLNLQTLDKRREVLCLSFAKKCLKNEKVKKFFPYNQFSEIRTRHSEIFKVNHANTERYKKSTIPYLQKLLNDEVKQKRNFLRWKGS